MPKLRRHILVMIFLLAAVRWVSVSAYGQAVSTGAITGRVADPSGATVVDARITATNDRTGMAHSMFTNSEGYYTFPLLNSGDYSVAVEKTGFRPVKRSGIVLDIAQTARIDFTLNLGVTTEQVTVTSEAPLLQTESGSLGQLVNATTTEQLPLNGRNFTALAVLTPGVTGGATNNPGATSNLRVNGMRDSKTLFSIGGASITDEHFSGARLVPPPDAIAEFRVQTNAMTAEYGAGGGVVNIELKSGTNQIHGSAYEFLRNDKLDARNFFATSRAILKQNQFGATLGAPVRKNKTFLFGDYEGTRLRRGQTFNAVVPSAAMKKGDFSGLPAIRDPLTSGAFTGNLIPTNRISPQAAFFLKYYPDPNVAGGIYNRNDSQATTGNQFDIRADHLISERDQLSGSYSYQRDINEIPGALPENGGTLQRFRTQLATIRETHSFRPNLINQFSGSYFRNFGLTTSQGSGANLTTDSGIGGFKLTGADYPGFPQLAIAGLTAINGGTNLPLRNFQDMKWVGDSITWVKGAHSIKAGVQARWYRFTAYNGGNSRGNFTFNGTYSGSSFADFLLGYPFSGTREFAKQLFGGFNTNQYFYVQDDWKVLPKLTINLGLRYELNHPRTGLNYQASTFDFDTNRIIVASDSNGNMNTTSQRVTQLVAPLYSDLIVPSSKAGLPQALKFMPKKDFAPRFGLAYQVTQGFVLRSGYGVYYGQEEGNRQGSSLSGNVPFRLLEPSNFNATPVPTKTLANLFDEISLANLNTGPLTFFDLEAHTPTPYFQQWNVTLEKLIGGALTAEAAYVGNKGTHVEYSYPMNIPLPAAGAIQNRRPNPRWANGVYIDNSSNAVYHGLQTKLQSRAWRGLTMLVAYTWSKSIDLISIDNQGPAWQGQNPLNVKAERAIGDYDVPHRFSASSVYQLPYTGKGHRIVGQVLGGWSMSSIITVQSGGPFTPGIQTDRANTGTTQRPNRLASGKLENPTIQRWYDVSAFALPALLTYGNSGRNILRSPGTANWNLGLFKTFVLSRAREGLRLQLRSEFFNVTNTAHFGTPVANIQAANAAQILNAGLPREIQFAAKLIF